MGLIKKLAVILVILIAVGAGITALIILTFPGAPKIPSDQTHAGRTTCFECHETGAAGAPQFPSSHLEKIEDGKLTDNINECLECHELGTSANNT